MDMVNFEFMGVRSGYNPEAWMEYNTEVAMDIIKEIGKKLGVSEEEIRKVIRLIEYARWSWKDREYAEANSYYYHAVMEALGWLDR